MSEQSVKLNSHNEARQFGHPVEKKLDATTPEAKIKEVYDFVEELGIPPERAMVRIFNSQLLAKIREFGTDRAKIDENDERRYVGVDFGYTKKLKKLGLRMEDGIYLIPLSQWAPTFTKNLFSRKHWEYRPIEQL